MAKEIPVYLFTGFLEAGKTKFIQETLEDSRFNSGEKTLLLVCEEGLLEYDPSAFSGQNVYLEQLEEESELTPELLAGLARQHDIERVVVEYNGMWMLDSFFNAMPEGWLIYQEFMFAETASFLSYNTNMRQLVYDKLKSCELVVFNRYDPSVDKMDLHRVVRGVSRRTDIAYESPDGTVEYDDIEDPLPFDIDAPVVTIRDKDYALWYRDLSEDYRKYEGKTLRVKGYIYRNKKLPAGNFLLGRRVMTCCIQDVQYMGVICDWAEGEAADRSWAIVEAKVLLKRHRAYGAKKGPVLQVLSLSPAPPPAEEIATFY